MKKQTFQVQQSAMIGLLRQWRLAAVIIFVLSQMLTQQMFQALLFRLLPFYDTFWVIGAAEAALRVSLPVLVIYSIVSFVLEGAFVDYLFKVFQYLGLKAKYTRVLRKQGSTVASEAQELAEQIEYLGDILYDPGTIAWALVGFLGAAADVILSAEMSAVGITDPLAKVFNYIFVAVACLSGETVLKTAGITPDSIVTLFKRVSDAGNEEAAEDVGE